MNVFIKWLILAALIIAAIACYSYGSTLAYLFLLLRALFLKWRFGLRCFL